MKIRPTHLLLLASGLLFISCDKAKKSDGTSSNEAETPALMTPPPSPAAATDSAPTPVADSPAMAQGPGGGPRGGGPGGGGGDRGAERMQRLTTELSLTPDQVDKVKAVFDSNRPAMDVIRADTTLSKEQRREKMREANKALEPQLSAILTPEQQAKWAEMRAKMGNRPGGGGGNGGGNQPAPAPAPTN